MKPENPNGPLLDNGLLKRVSVKTSGHSVVEELLGVVIYIRWHIIDSRYTRVEARYNISTVTLRVVGGDEKGSLKSETVKYGHEPKGTRTRERLC
jgi:hypothetical protein